MTYYTSEKGFAGLYMMVLVLVFSVSIIGSIGFGVVVQQRTVQNVVRSAQAQYVAESGVEDALLRLEKQWNAPSSYSVGVGGYSSAVTISDIVGGARTITVQGDATNRIRSAEVVYKINSTTIGFFYGAQVGNGGMQLDNNAVVNGNVFSNSIVTGANGSQITGTLQVAGALSGFELDNVDIGIDAYVDECDDATITGVLYTNSAGDCSYGSVTSAGLPVSPVALPILDSQITAWKQEAETGGVTTEDVTLTGSGNTLGPEKIVGKLVIDNNATLAIQGTVWVTGNVDIKNGAVVELASSYGTTSGMLIADGEILLDNNSVSRGSGQAGSYLMYISTSSTGQAIESKNNARADILYSNTGTIKVDNNAGLREVTGHAVHLQNNATITYETGLASASFTSGSGGGWSVESWKEVE